MTVVVVAGALANKPGNAGAAWTRASWVLAFEALGFEVHFVEQLAPQLPDIDGARTWFEACTRSFGIADRSTLLEVDGTTVCGLDADALRDLLAECAALVNISGHLRACATPAGRRIYVDLDPGYTQVWHDRGVLELGAHDHWFTVGTAVGGPGCALPTGDIDWVPTLQPVDLTLWPVVDPPGRDRWTTVGAWRGYGPIEVDGVVLGPKAHEFRRLLDLPASCPDSTFELALAIDDSDAVDRAALLDHGWQVVDPALAVPDPVSYGDYIRGSSGELSVAQAVYARTRCGWFSDRTARYLASGRPAIVQDTGLVSLPTGEGLVTFESRDEAVRAVDRVSASYDEHCRSARELAADHLDPAVVVGAMCERVGVAP